MGSGLESEGERGGWDVPSRQSHWFRFSETWLLWRMYALVALMIAAVLAGLVWGAWWLFVGEYR